MKAFMTACAFLAASANADSQMISSFNPLARSLSYGAAAAVPIGYTNAIDFHMMPFGGMPAYYRFRRDAEAADLPFEVRSKMTGPLSRQEYRVKVDRMGNGQSYQHVQRQVGPMTSMRYPSTMLDNQQRMLDQQRMDMDREMMVYNLNKDRDQQMMDMDRQRMMDRDQQMMDINRQRMMDRDQQMMDMERQSILDRDQQMMDMDGQRMLDQQMMDMDRQRMVVRDQQMMDMDRQRMLDRDQQIMDMDRQRMMDRDQQMMDMERQRLDMMLSTMDRQRDMDEENRYMAAGGNQMIQTHRMMIKREAESDPAFSYTVMSEHPSRTSFYHRLPAMARKNMNTRQLTMKQIHPDGAFSFVRQPFNFPSTAGLYNILNRIRPVAML